jgi:hypothetical protein
VYPYSSKIGNIKEHVPISLKARTLGGNDERCGKLDQLLLNLCNNPAIAATCSSLAVSTSAARLQPLVAPTMPRLPDK